MPARKARPRPGRAGALLQRRIVHRSQARGRLPGALTLSVAGDAQFVSSASLGATTEATQDLTPEQEAIAALPTITMGRSRAGEGVDSLPITSVCGDASKDEERVTLAGHAHCRIGASGGCFLRILDLLESEKNRNPGEIVLGAVF